MKHDYRKDPDSADAQGFLHWLEEQASEHLERDFGNADATRGSIFLFVNRACEAGLPDRLVRGDRVLVLGSEAHGLREGTLRAVDHRVRIPQAGRVGSLNVAAAAAVLLFELARRGRVASSP